MEGSVADLIRLRYERAEEMLKAAIINLEQKEYKTSLNRSYYSIFHAMRSVNLIDGFDSSKHSGVIAHFNQYYVKTGVFSSTMSDIIKSASYCREKSDYDDFYIVSKSDVEEQVNHAKIFLNTVKNYIDEYINADD